MKKLLTVSILALVFSLGNAQNRNVITAKKYGNKNGQTQFAKAKEAIDEAVNHADTKEDEKAWYYRGLIYQNIAESDKPEHKSLHENPIEEAVLSYKNSVKYQDKKGRYAKDALKNLNIIRGMSFNKGIAAFQAKEYDKAASFFRQSLEIGSLPEINFNDSAVFFNTALSYELAKNIDEAAKYYKLSAENSYKSVSCIRKIAEFALEKGDSVNYVNTLKGGIEKFADNQFLMLTLIDYYGKTKQFDEALSYLNLAIEKEPTNKILYFVKGSFFDNKNEPLQAIEAYKKAIELDANYFDAVFNLGAVFFNKGVDLNNKANEIPPQNIEEYDAMREKALAEFAIAGEYFEKALELNGKDLLTMKQLKQIYAQLRTKPEYAEKLKKIDALIEQTEQ